MSAPLLTAEEVAERLKVPRTWVYRAARQGELPSVRCGRYRRFDADDVDHWIEEQKGSLVLRAAVAVTLPTSQA
jgi:excisionase family DNA binding protein